MCQKYNLLKSISLVDDLNASDDATGILLVHDKISADEESRLKSLYPPGRVFVVGALWFYLSIYFNVELPTTYFEPSRQRQQSDFEPDVGDSTADLIRPLLFQCLGHFKRDSLDWQASHTGTYQKLKQAREARHKHK